MRFWALLLMTSITLLSAQSHAQEDSDLSAEEEQFLQEEFEPPQEAPYTTEVDPITAEPVLIKKEEEPPINANAPVTYEPGSEKPTTPYKQDGLKKVTAKGEYIYDVVNTPQTYAFGFKVGPFAPPVLSSTLDSGEQITFEDIYSDNQNLMFLVDIEWQFLQSIGKFALKAGSGFYAADGNGRFKRDTTLIAREEYSFYLMPNSLDLVWRLQFSSKQLFIPYAFAGANYFVFLETRDDNVEAKYGGSLAANAGAGLQIALDALDRRAVNEMDAEYGINRVYLVGEYQRIIGLSSDYDFSNDLFTGGFLLEF